MKHYTDNIGSDLIIAIDGDRQAIYSNQNTEQLYEAGVLNLNLIAKSSAKENNIHFIDLHPILKKHSIKTLKDLNFNVMATGMLMLIKLLQMLFINMYEIKIL